MINLPEITLCAASSVALPQTIAALEKSMANIAFGAVRLFTHESMSLPIRGIEVVKIPPIRSREDYSRFMLGELARHIETDFALIVQWDGYVLRPEAWRPEYLEFDYIGAIWPQFNDANSVGNGGFSLRSKKLLHACKEQLKFVTEAEDIAICRTNRKVLEQHYGIRFADSALASTFSYERNHPTGGEFGFHGVFNMIDVLGIELFLDYYYSLSSVIGRREHRDLFCLALDRGHNDLASNIVRNHLSSPTRFADGLGFLGKKILHDFGRRRA